MFQIGDFVKLASGGSIMEVIGISRNLNVWCEWWDMDGHQNEHSFHPAMLRYLDGMTLEMLEPNYEEMRIPQRPKEDTPFRSVGKVDIKFLNRRLEDIANVQNK